MRPRPDPVGPGQESVWDFPRPARAEPSTSHIVVVFNGVTIAETRRPIRVVETSHPPSWYIPRADIRPDALIPVAGAGSVCEWKGSARYFDVTANGAVAPRAAWGYPSPTASFAGIADCVALYCAPMDACFVDGERARPQPGRFYGGWITSRYAGPFKGVEGSQGW